MTNIEPVKVIEDYKLIEQVGTLAIKGYKNTEISRLLDISVVVVKKYKQDYQSLVQMSIDQNPEFLDQIMFNTKMVYAELDEISKEAWESVEAATEEGLLNTRIAALRLAMDVNAKKGQLLQVGVGSTSKTDREYIDRMRKAEQVNGLLTSVIQNVLAQCDRCREKARIDLAEAFALMPTYAEDAEVVDG